MAASVTVIHGSDEFLVSREAGTRTKKALKAGQLVQWFSAENHKGEIEGMLAGSFFDEPGLAVIFGDFGSMPKSGSGMRALVLLPGVEKAPGWTSGLDPKEVIKHSLPPPFKRDEHCLDFARIEARTQGFVGLSEKLLVPLVVSCGADKGLLSMELWKLLRVGGKDPSPEDLRKSALGPLQGDVWGLLEALGRKDTSRVFRALKILGREANVFRMLPLLGKQVSQWLVASHLLGKGEGSRIPQVLDLHPFVVKKSVLPSASKWSERALVALLRDLAQVGTKARQGIVSPWCLLQSALARALSTQ